MTILAAPNPSAPTFAPGTLVQTHFQVVRGLGEGREGVSYLARDLRHEDAHVVLKVYALAGAWSPVRAWEREARALENVTHAAIPRYVSHAQLPSGELLLVRAYAPGVPLLQRIDAGQRLSTEQVLDIAAQLLDVLVYLQDLNPPVVHGDIKPGNIVLDEQGRVKLIDFAGVRETLRAKDASGLGAGTPGYAAPEQASGQTHTGTDLYGLGATLVHLLSHVHPSDLPRRGLKLDFVSHVQVEPWLAAWLDRLLEPDPRERFSDAHAARLALTSKMNAASKTLAVPPAHPVPNAMVSLSPPRGSRLEVSTAANQLTLVQRGVGLFGPGTRAEALFVLLFGGMTTVLPLGALLRGSLGVFMFLTPMWIIALALGARTLFRMVGVTTIHVGPHELGVSRRLGPWRSRKQVPLREWGGAKLGEEYENRTRVPVCLLRLGTEDVTFGRLLPPGEQEWAVAVLNAWVAQIRTE